jgi:RND family efflux transporter MFP subunit
VVGAPQYFTPVSKIAVVQAHTQEIYPLVSGRVNKVYVSNSQTVAEGDTLFTIDPKPYQYAVDKLSAALKLAELKLKDTWILVKKRVAPRTNIDKYQSEVNQLRAQLHNAQYDLDNTVIKAPAEGIVSLVVLEEGQIVSASTGVMNFIQTDKVWLATAMKQNGMGRIGAGQQVNVIFPAAPGKIYSATVLLVPDGVVQGQFTAETTATPLSVLTSSENLYPVKIAIPAEATALLRRPGTLATVTIFTDEGNPINVLAKILQWISTWMNFIF